MPELSEDDLPTVNSLRAAVLRLSRRLRHGTLVTEGAQGGRADEPLSQTEMSVLGTLCRCGPSTPGELARKERVQPPSMTRIVAMLEAKGLVRRDPHPDDRRQVVVSHTERAQAILEESRRRRNAWLAQLAGGLTDEEWDTLRKAAPVLEKLAEL
ncbi:MarR family transcriptional regulator [Streptomyces capparidis]